jgi:signal transduction histidine kinase
MADSHPQRGEVEITLTAPEDLPFLQGDPHQLRQIFTNLLTNAFEAMDGRGGTVAIDVVQVAAEDEVAVGSGVTAVPMIQIDVADNGPGVAPDVLDKMFSPFFTTKPQGSGLGLAIVRKIVDAHDGRIDVASRPEGGVRFRVTLPVTAQYELFRST